jgi:hypothetical protein
VRVRSCAECSPVFDSGAVFVWTHRGVPAPMHPDYAAELSRLLSSSRVSGMQLPQATQPSPRSQPTQPAQRAGAAEPRVGDLVRLRGRGKYADLVGSIEARGRTRFRVRTELGLVSAPFALVEPVRHGPR